MKSTVAAALLAVLAGCASRPEPTDPEKVRIYESVTAAPQIGAILDRLWVESRMTAFVFPYYDSVEDAVADFRYQAAQRGGDGVINFACYRSTGRADAPLACNGTVVRFK